MIFYMCMHMKKINLFRAIASQKTYYRAKGGSEKGNENEERDMKTHKNRTNYLRD